MASPSPKEPVSSLQKAVKLVRQDLSLVNPSRLLPITFSLVAASVHKGIHSIPFPGDEAELLGCSSPDPSFTLPEDQCDVCFLHLFDHLQPYDEQEPNWNIRR